VLEWLFSGPRCKSFAYVPAVATATPSFLGSLQSGMVYLFVPALRKQAAEWLFVCFVWVIDGVACGIWSKLPVFLCAVVKKI